DCGSGDDECHGGDGDDTMVGGGGNDTCDGGAGNDLIQAWSEASRNLTNSSLSAGVALGVDALIGIERAELTGGVSANVIDCSLFTGKAILSGGAGADLLIGGLGADLLKCGDGDDTMVGGGGNDTCDGGAGNDLI